MNDNKQTQAGGTAGRVATSDWSDRIEVFIFGRRFGNTVGSKHGPYTVRVPECLWEVAPTGDYFSLTITARSAPFFLHRWAQTIFLGIRYRRTKV